MANILFLRNFREDNRISMEVYADNLLQALDQADSGLNIRYYRPASRFSKPGGTGKLAMRAARYLEYPAQLRRFNADLYHIAEHGYAHLLRQLPAKRTIVTVHDVIPLLKYKGAINGVTPDRRPWLAEYSLKHLKTAAHLIAISENTKSDLVEHCGCTPEKISVVYYGLPNARGHESISKSQAREALNLPHSGEKLILATGQDFYKNMGASVQVFNRLSQDNNVRLVHLGRTNPIWQQARALADNPESIIELEHIPHRDVIKLYKAVDCVLFPSWYEGFGLPPLEAMACGTPAVTSNAASLPEAVGPMTLTANPDDIDGLATAVETVLFDLTERTQQIEQGQIHARQFSWQRCAEQTMAIYQQVLDG